MPASGRTTLMVAARLRGDNRRRIAGIARGTCQEATAAAFRAEIHRLAVKDLARGGGGRIDGHPAHRVDNHFLLRRGSVRCSLNGSVHDFRPCLLSLYRQTRFRFSPTYVTTTLLRFGCAWRVALVDARHLTLIRDNPIRIEPGDR